MHAVQQPLERALQQVGLTVTLSADRKTVMSADGVVVPGIGRFSEVLEQLREVDGETLIDQRLARSLPVLGINTGFQVLFSDSEDGLEQWPGTVVELASTHDSWAQVRPQESLEILDGLQDQEFYFTHDLALVEDPWKDHSGPLKKPAVAWASQTTDDDQASAGEAPDHSADDAPEGQSIDFIAAVENGPLVATQFHPEMSGEAGLQLLENWAKTL